MPTAPSDPVADLLTRMRNALQADQRTVEMPPSKLRLALARLMLDEGFIYKVEVVEAKKAPPKPPVTDASETKPPGKRPTATGPRLRLTLKYTSGGDSVVRGLRRISRPGRRYFRGADKLPRVQGGLGIAIISTSAGLLTDHQARTRGLGGEVMCYLW